MVAFIGYENLLQGAGATITASTEATGFEVENSFNWYMFDWWKPTAAGTHTLIADLGSAKSVDYFGCASHTIADNSGNIRLFYSDTGTSGPWTGVFTAVTPTDSSVILKSFASLSKRYWKVEIVDSGSPSQIGIVSFGARLDLPYGMMPGFVPPLFHYKNEINVNKTESGNHLVSSVKRRGIEFNIKMPPLLSTSFARGDYLTFLQHAYAGKAFFFEWDSTNHAGESVLAKVRNFQPVTYANQMHMEHDLACHGFIS